MVKHRGFTLQKFLTAAGEPLIREYFQDRGTPMPDSISVISEQPFQQFLDTLPDEDQQAVLEDLHCVNDVAEQGKDHLEEAKQAFQIDAPDDEPRERTALTLFLRDREGAFRYAYDGYRYRLVASKLQHYQLPVRPPTFDSTAVGRFRDDVQRFYQEQSKGAGCLVRERREADTACVIASPGRSHDDRIGLGRRGTYN